LNSEDFRRVFKKISPEAHRLALGIIGDDDEASDAIQEAFMRVYEARESFRGESALATWIFSIVTNTCRTRRRLSARPKRLRVPLDIADQQMDHSLELWEFPSENPERLYIRKIIDTFPKREAQALRLYYYREYSYARIAREMHTSVSAVAALLTRARERLEIKITKFRTDMRKETVE
jgi:RNA polymerase sigma-70 factor (ECF subfamily)